MKKKIILLLLFAVSIYAIYFDLKHGTLPATPVPVTASVDNKNKEEIPYFEETVQAGDTLLSIMERKEGKLSKPIHMIMLDFQKLNNGISPHELQIGKTYKFPSYMKP